MNAQSKLQLFSETRAKALGATPARKRINLLCDADSFVELDGFSAVDGNPCGVVCGYGAIMGSPVCVFAQDSTENGGAVGAVHAGKIARLYDWALKVGAPVVGIYDSNGARVSEGAEALNAYGEILLRANNLSGVVPQIALVLGTCAGASALLSCSADFVVMSEAAELFLTPPSLSKDGTGGGTALNAEKAGVAHFVRPNDADACETARRLVATMPLNNLASPPICEFNEPVSNLTALCASGDEADVAAIAQSICDAGSLLEVLADFGAGAYTALATMGGLTCGIAATRPGKLAADDCAKISKLVTVCDSFQIPVITLVNTSGFASSAAEELCGCVRDMARLAHVYAEATTPKIALITGKAYGAAYIALCSRAANADYTIAWPTAEISALAPAAAVAFLYADKISAETSREQLVEEYISTDASPLTAAANGAINDVIDPAITRPALLSALDLLSAKRVSRNPKKHSNIPL